MCYGLRFLELLCSNRLMQTPVPEPQKPIGSLGGRRALEGGEPDIENHAQTVESDYGGVVRAYRERRRREILDREKEGGLIWNFLKSLIY